MVEVLCGVGGRWREVHTNSIIHCSRVLPPLEVKTPIFKGKGWQHSGAINNIPLFLPFPFLFCSLCGHQQDLGLGRFWRLIVRGLRRMHIEFLLIAERESVPRP